MFFENFFLEISWGEGWGRGRDGTWRYFGLKLTKKRKTFKVIDFKNFKSLNLKANIFKSFFTEKCPFLTFFFSLEISWGRGWRGGDETWRSFGFIQTKNVKYWDLKIFNIFYFYISNLKANIFKSFFTEKWPFLTFFFLSKSHGGGVGGVGMKHLGPLDLNKPKTFSYWDFKNFNISKSIFFKVFFHQYLWFFRNFFFKISWGERWGVGEGLYRNPNVVEEHKSPKKML